MNPACDARVFGSGAPAWDQLAEDPRAILVKSGKQRSVWRIALNSETVYAKVFLDSGRRLGGWVKRLFGLHPAQREWRMLQKLERRGVPAIRAIALGTIRSGRNGSGMVLVTQGVEGSETLQTAWEALNGQGGLASESRRRKILVAVADLWVAAHSRGFCHPDSHPANVLISGSAGESRVTARFLDPSGPQWARWSGRPASRGEVLRSMAMLDQYFHRRASRTERLRFWREYWVRRNLLLDAKSERRLLFDLARVAEVHRAVLARRRDRRLAGDGKYFGRLALGNGWRGVVTLRLERRHVFDERNVPDRSTEEWRAILRKFVETGDSKLLDAHGLIAMRRPVNHRGPWAGATYDHAHRLRHRDIAAPLILGFVQRSSLGSIRDEYLILPANPLKQAKGGMAERGEEATGHFRQASKA